MDTEKCSSYWEGPDGGGGEIQCRVKSILISKCNQYGTCQGSYEVNWTKEISFMLKPAGETEREGLR